MTCPWVHILACTSSLDFADGTPKMPGNRLVSPILAPNPCETLVRGDFFSGRLPFTPLVAVIFQMTMVYVPDFGFRFCGDDADVLLHLLAEFESVVRLAQPHRSVLACLIPHMHIGLVCFLLPLLKNHLHCTRRTHIHRIHRTPLLKRGLAFASQSTEIPSQTSTPQAIMTSRSEAEVFQLKEVLERAVKEGEKEGVCDALRALQKVHICMLCWGAGRYMVDVIRYRV
jgi:hypothetical protein